MNTPPRTAPPAASATPVGPVKILVAVHGIGDQIGYATAQSVASQVGAYYNITASIPLGRLFDLVFIWHRYIRHAAALESIAEIAKGGYVPSKLEARISRGRSGKRT